MMVDDSRSAGDGQQHGGGLEDPEDVRKGAVAMGDSSHAGGPGGGASATVGVRGTAGRAAGRTCVQRQSAMTLFTWGERFLRVQEMGRPEGLEETELVVRRHRMMEKGKGQEKNPEV